MTDHGRLGLGTATLGNLLHAMSDDDAWQILDAAWESGIRHFDTAPHYGLGLAERRLGAFLATKPRTDFIVSTKVGRVLVDAGGTKNGMDTEHDFVVPADRRRVWDFSADGVRRSLDDSLGRLGLDAFDVAYLHDPERHDLDRGIDDALPALAKLRDEGVVRSAGIASMANEALYAAASSGLIDVAMVASRYTLADESAAEIVLPECSARQIDVVAAAVFASGLLATPAPSDESLFDYGPVPTDVLDRTRCIASVCAEFDVALPVAALHFPLRHGAVRAVVVGATSPDQVRQNVAALGAGVPDELWCRLQNEGLIR